MKIFDIKILPLYKEEFLKKITKLEKTYTVFTPNPEILLEARKDKGFKKNLQKSTYLTSDGIGLYIGYQIQDFKKYFSQKGILKYVNIALFPYYFLNLFFRRKHLYKKYGERICGSDLTLDILNFAQKNSIRVAIIDLYKPEDIGKVESQKNFGKKLTEKYPQLGFDYHIYKSEDISDIYSHIDNSDCKIVFSTLGMKKQEDSIVSIMSHCKNVKLGLGVGSSFDYIIGFQKRAPKIMRKLGLEWLYRLFTSPGKIQRMKRIFKAVCVFPIIVLFDNT